MGEPDEALTRALEAVRERHFRPDGHVRTSFGAIDGSDEAIVLRHALLGLARFDPRALPIPGPITFWINAYNAALLLAAFDARPGQQVLGLPGFFDAPRIHVAGQVYSADDIEHGLLRGNVPKYGRAHGPFEEGDPRLEQTPRLYDERMHFALYTAARGSPGFAVYHAERLDRQLETATRAYLARFVEVDAAGETMLVPRQFKWYARDFGGEAASIDFVLARIDDDAVLERIDRNGRMPTLRYATFDWMLDAGD